MSSCRPRQHRRVSRRAMEVGLWHGMLEPGGVAASPQREAAGGGEAGGAGEAGETLRRAKPV
jgi:hypothetical protein